MNAAPVTARTMNSPTAPLPVGKVGYKKRIIRSLPPLQPLSRSGQGLDASQGADENIGAVAALTAGMFLLVSSTCCRQIACPDAAPSRFPSLQFSCSGLVKGLVWRSRE